MWEEPSVLSNDLIPKGVVMGWIGREGLEDTRPIKNEQFHLPKHMKENQEEVE